MKLKDICIDTELEKNINLLHDIDLQREFMRNNNIQSDSCEVITKYRYGHFGIDDYYDSIQELKSAYKLNIGRTMSDEEINIIKAHFFLRLHNRKRGELWMN